MTAMVCGAGRGGMVRFETFCAPAPGPRDLLSILLQMMKDHYRRMP